MRLCVCVCVWVCGCLWMVVGVCGWWWWVVVGRSSSLRSGRLLPFSHQSRHYENLIRNYYLGPLLDEPPVGTNDDSTNPNDLYATIMATLFPVCGRRGVAWRVELPARRGVGCGNASEEGCGMWGAMGQEVCSPSA
jgi:hypothetical protein